MTSPFSPPSLSDRPPPAWKLDHVAAYPSSHDISLRSAYTSNLLAQSSRARSTRTVDRPATGSPDDRETPSFPAMPYFPPSQPSKEDDPAAATNAEKLLMEQLAFHPTQPFTMPPGFITSFVRRVFTDDICLVDFTQALTALDYLRDLEIRRKREFSAAIRRLNIDKDLGPAAREAYNRAYPGVAEWVAVVEDKEKRVDALYTQIYIGLRRWTLINEMRLGPFNRANCVAMLDTLYPATYTSQPTPQLTEKILVSQRSAFFRYISAVEKNGKGVLVNLENQNRRPGDANGWPVVREILDKYLRSANGLIEECSAVKSTDDFEHVSKGATRTDSGVSLSSAEGTRNSYEKEKERRPRLEKLPSTLDARPKRPNMVHAKTSPVLPTTGTVLQEKSVNKPLPTVPPTEIAALKRNNATTLERIAREIRRMKAKSADSKDDADARAIAVGTKKSLKKMRSSSDIQKDRSVPAKTGKHARGQSSERAPVYEIDEAKRQKLIADARRRGKENREPERRPSPVRLASTDYFVPEEKLMPAELP